MNAKCRVQNAKVKMKEYKLMAQGHTAILQFAFYNLTFAIFFSVPPWYISLFYLEGKGCS